MENDFGEPIPPLLSSKIFINMVTTLHPTLDPTCTPQQQWELIKIYMVKFIKQYCCKCGSWRQKQLKALQSKRNNFLRKQKSPVIRSQILPTIETQITILQKEITDILTIHSGTTWREKSEISAGYLKRTIQQWQTSKYIAQLKHPNTDTLHSDPARMQDATTQFYQSLYTTDDVIGESIDRLLNTLPSNSQLDSSAAESLSEAFDIEELRQAAKKSPKQSVLE